MATGSGASTTRSAPRGGTRFVGAPRCGRFAGGARRLALGSDPVAPRLDGSAAGEARTWSGPPPSAAGPRRVVERHDRAFGEPGGQALTDVDDFVLIPTGKVSSSGVFHAIRSARRPVEPGWTSIPRGPQRHHPPGSVCREPARQRRRPPVVMPSSTPNSPSTPVREGPADGVDDVRRAEEVLRERGTQTRDRARHHRRARVEQPVRRVERPERCQVSWTPRSSPIAPSAINSRARTGEPRPSPPSRNPCHPGGFDDARCPRRWRKAFSTGIGAAAMAAGAMSYAAGAVSRYRSRRCRGRRRIGIRPVRARDAVLVCERLRPLERPRADRGSSPLVTSGNAATIAAIRPARRYPTSRSS